jgi:serine/threonine protein kinase
VKILDIGLGRELFEENSPEGQVDTQLTAEGAVLGTPDYLAPEQARDARTADIRADIYSLGCVLYHCLTGQPPFPESNVMAQLLKHATEKPAPVKSFVPDVPSELQNVLDGMLAKSPNDRFATPAQAAAALSPFLESGTTAKAAALVPAFKAWLETESQLELPKTLPAPPLNPKTAPAPPIQPGGSAPAWALPSKTTGPKPTATRVGETNEVNVELVPEPLPASLPLSSGAGVQIGATTETRGPWEFDRRDWIMLASGAASVLGAVGIGYGLARLIRKKPEDEPPAVG